MRRRSTRRHVDEYVGASRQDARQPLPRRRADALPDPGLPAPPARAALLDIGSNWGRWTIAAARAGFAPTGIDPSEKAIAAARRVARAARRRGASTSSATRASCRSPDASVRRRPLLQRPPAPRRRRTSARAVAEIRRVLRPGGLAWIEMPNAHGPLNLVAPARAAREPARASTSATGRAPSCARRSRAIGPVELSPTAS